MESVHTGQEGLGRGGVRTLSSVREHIWPDLQGKQHQLAEDRDHTDPHHLSPRL